MPQMRAFAVAVTFVIALRGLQAYLEREGEPQRRVYVWAIEERDRGRHALVIVDFDDQSPSYGAVISHQSMPPLVSTAPPEGPFFARSADGARTVIASHDGQVRMAVETRDGLRFDRRFAVNLNELFQTTQMRPAGVVIQ